MGNEDLSYDDPRLEFIQDFVITALKIKQDKWNKHINQVDNKNQLQAFFDQSSILLIIYSAPVGYFFIMQCCL